MVRYIIGGVVGISYGASLMFAFHSSAKPSPQTAVVRNLNEDEMPDYVIQQSDKRTILLSQPDGSYKTKEDVEKEMVKKSIRTFREGIESKIYK